MNLADAASNKGKAANNRFQKTIKKSGTQQNKKVQAFSYLDPLQPAQLGQMAGAQIRSGVTPVINQLNKMFAQQQAALNSQYNRQQTQGIGDITTANKAFVQGAGQYTGQLTAANDAAIHGQQLLDQGINQFLQETGQHVGGDVAGQLAGAPEAMQQSANQQLGGLAAGVQGQALGQGASTMSRMLTQKAADINYGNLLPNVARAMGEQDTSLFTRNVSNARSDALSQLSQQRATAVGDVTSKVPGMVNDLYQNLYNAEVQKAELNRAYGLDVKQLNAKTSASASAHYQLKHQVNKDGSTTYFSYDPATGGAVPGSEWTVPGQPGGKGSPKFGPADKAYSSALSTAQELHKNLNKALNGYIIKDEFGKIIAQSKGIPLVNKAARVAAQIRFRSNAVSQVLAPIREGHPDWTPEQVGRAAAHVLQQAGFPIAANIAEGRITQAEADRATRLAAGLLPSGGKSTQTGPEGPVGTPSGLTGPLGTPTAVTTKTKKPLTPEEQAKQAAQAALAKAQAYQGTTKVAYNDVTEKVKNGEYPHTNSEVRIARYIVSKYPSIPMEKAREVARAALAQFRA